MLRQIVQIDESKCDGCGLCARACHENAILIVNGKAKLIKADYCDGMGDCLPACPQNAIQILEQEAAAYDPAAVAARQQEAAAGRNFPIQLKLVTPTLPYLSNRELLVAADCSGYMIPDFHARFAQDRAVVIGCPKLDNCDYEERITALLQANRIPGVVLTRMQVPCCGGLEQAVRAAVAKANVCGLGLTLRVVVLDRNGQIIRDESR